MKHFITILATSLSLLIVAQAAAPKNPTFAEYQHIPERSPFVIKKKAEAIIQAKPNNSLTLRGVSKFKSGWIVTLVDRKDPKKSIVLREGQPANKKGIRLLKVNQSKDGYAKTTAVVLTGGRQVTVNFNMASIKKSHTQSAKGVKASKPRASNSRTKASSKRPPIPVSSSKNKPKKSTSGRRPRVRRTAPPVQTK